MPNIFEQWAKELKMAAISELNNLAAIFTGVDINKCDLSSKKGLADLIYEWSKNYLGISNSNNSDEFLVPGLTTPSLLSGKANNSTLTLKNTKELVKDLKNAKKTFEEIPGGEINYEHRYQTLLYLEELISLLKNILKAMEQIKKLCPLHSGSEKLYKLLQNLINCFNRLILFCDQKVPSTLNTEGVKKKFYEENLKKIEQITVQELKKLAEENLKKYYKSWGVSTQNFGKSKEDPPFRFEDAKIIFDAIQDLNEEQDGRFLGVLRATPQRDVNINSRRTKLPLKATPNPIDPQEKLGENPFVCDYKTWLEIYTNTSDDGVKKIAEEKVEKMVSNQEGTSQIKDIACGIKKLSNQTKSKLIEENGCALIEFLHESLDIREESTKSAKKTTLSDLQKLASNLISKATNTFDSMKKLKKKSQTKLPLLKVKNVKDDNEEINKMKELLDYNLDSPKEPPTYGLTINSETSNLLKIKDNKINLKQFLENISDKLLLILRFNDDDNEQKISNFETIIKATLYFFDLTDIWQSQVKELLKQLDTSNIPEDDTIIYTAKMYMDIHKKIISSDSKLKSIANKIKLLRKIKFNKKELIYLCNELVESIDQQTTDEKTIKETSEHLKKYTEMSGLFKEYYPLIKRYPKHYANFTKTYKELNGDKRALAQKEKIEKIYPIFKNYMLNIDNHSDLYNKTYQPDSKFLKDILEFPLIQNDTKLKTKSQLLLKELTGKFKDQHGGTPEEYIELTQKIDKLCQKVNEKLYNNMKNHRDKNNGNFTDTEMSQLMNEVDKTIKSDTDNLKQYQTFIKILNRSKILRG